MAKEEKAYEKLGLVHSTHESLIRVFEDYQGRTVTGIQRGTDHQPLIRILYPLYLDMENFALIDDDVKPIEIRLKVVMVYDANERIKNEYIKACAKLFKNRKALEMVGEENHD